MIARPLAALAAALLLAAGCRAERAVDPDPSAPALRTAPALSGSYERDAAELARLDEAVAAIARTDGCADAASCATVAVGSRACGGPRHYVVYCRRTTDEALLRRQAAEVSRFEEAMNQRYNLVSTCEYRLPPTVESSGGACRAAPAGVR